MPGVKADITVSIAASLIGAADLGTPRQTLDTISQIVQFAPGTASVGQADILFADTRTLAASATENLDLAGVLTNAFGTVIAAAEVVAIYVKAADANTNSVVIGAAASTPFAGPLGATGTYAVLPGEYFLAVSQKGWAVAAGTADLLKIANSSSGTPVTYDIVIIGRTVAA